jgi:hypothetical protein
MEELALMKLFLKQAPGDERKAGIAEGLTEFNSILSNQETCKLRTEA